MSLTEKRMGESERERGDVLVAKEDSRTGNSLLRSPGNVGCAAAQHHHKWRAKDRDQIVAGQRNSFALPIAAPTHCCADDDRPAAHDVQRSAGEWPSDDPLSRGKKGEKVDADGRRGTARR